MSALGNLFSDIAGAIREKTGETGTMKPAQFPEKILGIEVGGVTSPDLRYVTFKSHDGAVIYGTKPVAVGDDCADPIKRGLFSTPARESTAQYNYTFLGWSVYPNSTSADTTALKSVNYDRTLFACYKATVREYTITYYDGDEVLKTEILAYGETPSYGDGPMKEGYNFMGWSPAIGTVTGDISYHAQWEVRVGLDGMSWDEIAAVSEAGKAAQYFSIGETKTIIYTYSDGTEEELTLEIVGFDHDDLSDGSGKAGITFLNKKCPVNEKTPYINNSSVGGVHWANSDLRKRMTDTVIPALPDDLVSHIKTVNKVCDGGYNSPSLVTLSETLWVPSVDEFGLDTSSTDYKPVAGQGTVYERFATDQSNANIRRVYKSQYGLIPSMVWLRNSCSGTWQHASVQDGEYDYEYYNQKYFICFGFCV